MSMQWKALSIGVMLVAASVGSYAAVPMVEALRGAGMEVRTLDDGQMALIKGTARITGYARPSVTQGIKTHQVTWKKRGSQSDYRAYQYQGFDYSPHEYKWYRDGGTLELVAGDVWLADSTSRMNAWNRANAREIEHHYQALDRETKAPRNYGFRASQWSRPISTFRW
ncbi:hypothetical protein AHFPHNDE_03568 [Pseudomonas sp. MM227]|uniref:hypothetical protein n=1 Tax=Pseudomonas sp. MM227 TaxID=3019968 RepID=UPI0022200167|nr:hypothetical protein [Pseudomonas sp. MM227]CAI3789859.1 hypothetical protein AHFPHNDE_03568 [Pseudomonas sp. MM227]